MLQRKNELKIFVSQTAHSNLHYAVAKQKKNSRFCSKAYICQYDIVHKFVQAIDRLLPSGNITLE